MEGCIDFSMVDLVVREHFLTEETGAHMRFEGRTVPRQDVVGDTIGSVNIDLYLPATFPFKPVVPGFELVVDACHIMSTASRFSYLNEVARALGPREKISAHTRLTISFADGTVDGNVYALDPSVANTTVWVGQFMLGLFVNFMYYALAEHSDDEGEETLRRRAMYATVREITNRYLNITDLPGAHCRPRDIVTYAGLSHRYVVMEVGRDSVILVRHDQLVAWDNRSDDTDTDAMINVVKVNRFDKNKLTNLTRKGYIDNGGVVELIGRYTP